MKKEFVIQRQGKDMVLYAGLLDAAHEKGLVAINTHLVQVPDESNGNVAIVHATASFVDKRFDGIGDAAPNNVAPPMRTALIRMAETRAKARALRDAINVGAAAFEELGPDEEDDRRGSSKPEKTFSISTWLDWFRAAKPNNKLANREEIDAACTDWDKALKQKGAAAIVVAWATNGQGFVDIGSHAMSVLSVTATSSKFTDADCQLIQKAAQLYVDNLPVEQPEATQAAS